MDQKQIGKFIAELRNERGITQAKLGEKIGVTNKTVSRWENGNYMPDLSVIIALCAELGISANELLCARRLNDLEFKVEADDNLIKTLKQVKHIKHQKSIIDFFTGAGIGLVVSCVFSPYSTRKMIALMLGLTMIGIGLYKKSRYDKMVLEHFEEPNQRC